MPVMIIIMSFLPTLVSGLVLSILTRSALISVIGGAFIGISIRDGYFDVVLQRAIYYKVFPYYLIMLVISMIVASFGTLVFSLGIKYVADERKYARNWACTLVAVCCSAPLAIPTTPGALSSYGVAPIATLSLGTLAVYWVAFIVAVIGVIREQRFMTLAATLLAVLVALCTVSFGDARSGGVNLLILPAVAALIASIVDLRSNRLVVIRGDTLRMQREASARKQS